MYVMFKFTAKVINEGKGVLLYTYISKEYIFSTEICNKLIS